MKNLLSTTQVFLLITLLLLTTRILAASKKSPSNGAVTANDSITLKATCHYDYQYNYGSDLYYYFGNDYSDVADRKNRLDNDNCDFNSETSMNVDLNGCYTYYWIVDEEYYDYFTHREVNNEDNSIWSITRDIAVTDLEIDDYNFVGTWSEVPTVLEYLAKTYDNFDNYIESPIIEETNILFYSYDYVVELDKEDNNKYQCGYQYNLEVTTSNNDPGCKNRTVESEPFDLLYGPNPSFEYLNEVEPTINKIKWNIEKCADGGYDIEYRVSSRSNSYSTYVGKGLNFIDVPDDVQPTYCDNIQIKITAKMNLIGTNESITDTSDWHSFQIRGPVDDKLDTCNSHPGRIFDPKIVQQIRQEIEDAVQDIQDIDIDIHY